MMVEPNSLNKIPFISSHFNSGNTVEDAGINSIYSDYGTAIYSNKLVLLRPEILVVLDSENTNGPIVFYKFYTTDLDADLTPSTNKPKSLMGQLTLSFMSLLLFFADGKPCTYSKQLSRW
jgi:hypothetical protein